MLPPDSTAIVVPVADTRPERMAATPAAPAGSTTTFACSRSTSIARARSSSETVTTSSTSSLMISNGTAPGRATRMPSAMVGRVTMSTGSPAASDGGTAAAFSACTPITRIVRPSSAALAFTAAATPAISPPPPIPRTTVSISGASSSSSRPSVPCPMTMSR